MWWRVEVVGEPHGAELTGEGGSRRSREAEQSAARSVQLHACTGMSLHTCTQVRVYSVHSPLMRFFLLFFLFILKYECLFLNQSLSACQSQFCSQRNPHRRTRHQLSASLFSPFRKMNFSCDSLVVRSLAEAMWRSKMSHPPSSSPSRSHLFLFVTLSGI